MNDQVSNSDRLAALKKSMTFWGRQVWLSSITMIVSPIFTVYSIITTVPASLDRPRREQIHILKILREMIEQTVGITTTGVTVTLLALLLFVISLLLLTKRGKRLQKLAEEMLAGQAATHNES